MSGPPPTSLALQILEIGKRYSSGLRQGPRRSRSLPFPTYYNTNAARGDVPCTPFHFHGAAAPAPPTEPSRTAGQLQLQPSARCGRTGPPVRRATHVVAHHRRSTQ
eukprot:scaffold6347_cov124-Isochrysis_galbana.AAC.5